MIIEFRIIHKFDSRQLKNITIINQFDFLTITFDRFCELQLDPFEEMGIVPSFFNLKTELFIEGMRGADRCFEYKFHEERGYNESYFDQVRYRPRYQLCIALYCIVLYCIVQHYAILSLLCIWSHGIVLNFKAQCFIFYCSVSHAT